MAGALFQHSSDLRPSREAWDSPGSLTPAPRRGPPSPGPVSGSRLRVPAPVRLPVPHAVMLHAIATSGYPQEPTRGSPPGTNPRHRTMGLMQASRGLQRATARIPDEEPDAGHQILPRVERGPDRAHLSDTAPLADQPELGSREGAGKGPGRARQSTARPGMRQSRI